jgi:hypothetical protein
MGQSAISDGDVARALALFDRGAAALLDLLRRAPGSAESSPAEATNVDAAERHDNDKRRIVELVDAVTARALDALLHATLPDPDEWPDKPLDERCQWWTTRIRHVGALVPAAPRVLGFVADRLPVAATTSAAVQGMAVVAVAQESGVADPHQRTALLSRILTNRPLDATQVAELLGAPTPLTRRLREVIGYDEIVAAHGPRRMWLIARAVGRLAGIIGDIEDVLDGRQRGRLAARALGQLPVVGAVGGYLAERTAVARAADRARADLARTPEDSAAGAGSAGYPGSM